jgi:prefoldin subunit 5
MTVEFEIVAKAFEILDTKKKEFVAALSAQFINIPDSNENFSNIRDFYAEDFFSRAQNQLNIFLERGNLSLEQFRSNIMHVYDIVFNGFNISMLREFPEAMTAREQGKEESTASTDSNSLKDVSKEQPKNKRKAGCEDDVEDTSIETDSSNSSEEPPRKKWREEGKSDTRTVATVLKSSLRKRKIECESDKDTIIMDADGSNNSEMQQNQKKKKAIVFDIPEKPYIENSMSYEEFFYKKCLKFLEEELWKFEVRKKEVVLDIEQKKYIENAIALLSFFGDFILDLSASSSIEKEITEYIFILKEKIAKILKKTSHSNSDCQNFTLFKNIIDVFKTLYLKDIKKDAKSFSKRMKFRKAIKYDHLKDIKFDLTEFLENIFEEDDDLYEDDLLENNDPNYFVSNPLVQPTEKSEEKNKDEIFKEAAVDNNKSDVSDFWIPLTKELGYQKSSNASRTDPPESDGDKMLATIDLKAISSILLDGKDENTSSNNNMLQVPISVGRNVYIQNVERAISYIESETQNENFAARKFKELESFRKLLNILKDFDDEVFEVSDYENLQGLIEISSPGLGNVFAEVMTGSISYYDSITSTFSY